MKKIFNIIKIVICNFIQKRKYSIYKSIDFCPIWNFKKVETTKDLRYLIKGIDYENMPKIYLNLEKYWVLIVEEYANSSNPEYLNNFKSAFITIEQKKRCYMFIRGAIDILSKRDFLTNEQQEKIISKVKSLGYKFDSSTEEKYYNSILDLNRQSKGLLKVISQKNEDFNKNFNNSDVVNQDIEEILSTFTETYGIFFDSKIITVKQYITWLSKFNKKASENKKEWQKEK